MADTATRLGNLEAPGSRRPSLRPPQTPRFEVMGVRVSAASMEGTLRELSRWIDEGVRSYVCVSDTNGVVSASRDEALRVVYNESGLTLPDGMPLVWYGRRCGYADMTRVCGPDLMPRLLALAAERGWSSYFYGGAPGVADELVARFGRQIRGLRVAGVASPPFRPLTAEETARDIAAINDSGAKIVWVGLGAPKQERWMAEHRHLLEAPVVIGVGAAFDMHSGRLSRAPRWMQRCGLEWAYRLAKEPRRLWRRYARVVPAFIVASLRHPPRATPGVPIGP